MGFWSGLLASLYGNEAKGDMTKERQDKIDRLASRRINNLAAAQSGHSYRIWDFNGRTVYAHTKSEARAKLKEIFGAITAGSVITAREK